MERVRDRLSEIRGDIAFGKTSFEEAARKYSQAPDADQGGDMGWIDRWAPLGDFCRGVFDLPVGALSGPIHSFEGMHIAKVTDIRPGTITFEQAKERLKKEVASGISRSILEEAVEPKIEFTGNYPYISREDGRLVVPNKSAS
jgi:parvulin-like peptidyl-prolyl isomerase